MSLEDGESFGTSLSSKRVRRFRRNEPRYPGQEPPYLRADAAALVHALELDGFTVSEGRAAVGAPYRYWFGGRSE